MVTRIENHCVDSSSEILLCGLETRGFKIWWSFSVWTVLVMDRVGFLLLVFSSSFSSSFFFYFFLKMSGTDSLICFHVLTLARLSQETAIKLVFFFRRLNDLWGGTHINDLQWANKKYLGTLCLWGYISVSEQEHANSPVRLKLCT